MPSTAKYRFIVSMDVAPEKEALFNEVYDQEHIPNLLEVPVAGPAYTAIYELASAEVLASEAWGRAVEAGRWPTEVRPFTTNRRHVLAKVI
jgi:hypothetical protein